MKSLNSYPQFLELARNRYSCRKFDSRPVSRGLILAVIEAAQLAPSARNQQPWTFLVIECGDARREVAASYGRDWINTPRSTSWPWATSHRPGYAPLTAKTTWT